MDEFSSRLIPLNYQQVEQLDKGSKLGLQTTQFTAKYLKRDASGGNIYGGDWNLYIPQIHQKTTGITLDLANQESIERRIVAKNLKDPNDRTPVLTVQEAIIKSFGADSTNGNIVYEDEQTRRKFNISEKEVAVIVDKQIEAEINRSRNK